MRTGLYIVILCCTGISSIPAQQGSLLIEDYRFGSFQNAVSIEVDMEQYVYVTDATTHTLSKFKRDGTLLKKIGGRGWDINQLDTPHGVDVRLGIVTYIADTQNHRIVRFDKDLHPIGTFSTRNNPALESHFGYPLDIAVSGLGGLFILDGENNRVVTTSGFATIEGSFGGVESGPGRLKNPIAMDVDESDYLYVLESERVVVFDGFGVYVRSFGASHLRDAHGITVRQSKCFVIDDIGLQIFSSDGSHLRSYTQEDFIFQTDAGDFRDVTFFDSGLLLLTSKSVIVLRESQ